MRSFFVFLLIALLSSTFATLQTYSNFTQSTQWANLAWSNSGSHVKSKYDYANVVELDGFDATTTQINNLHTQKKLVLCYISTGSAENWRPDYKDFPAATLGPDMKGWSGEKWLLVKNWVLLKPIMSKRLTMLKQKGCDGYEGDNMDMYTAQKYPQNLNDTIAYAKWLSETAHSLNLSAVWKNALQVIPKIVNNFEAVIDEQCLEYSECNQLSPFWKANKAVWVVSYSKSTATTCKQKTSSMSTLLVDTTNGYFRCT